jgi:polysaccharide export outer membrane protein
MAGDLTEFGNRKEVRIIRNLNGKNNIYNLDITRPDIVASTFYYLQPNDVIYIQPLATRRYGLDDNWVQIALSAATTLILFLNYFTN